MQILLPPSEGKRTARSGRPVDLSALSFPELTASREIVLDALIGVSARPDAAELLGVGDSLVDEVAANARLRTAPAAPVSTIYSGVLYDALGWPSLSTSAKRRAGRRLVVASALWGAVRFGDRIPAYRLSMDTTLPGIGPLAAYWREPLAKAMGSAIEGHLVVDCRSATYAAAWKPAPEVADRVVAVRVFREAAGRRTVVSHMAKHTRGEVVRHLLERPGRDPGTPARLAAAVGEAFRCELTEPTRAGSPWALDVVVEV